MGVQLSHWTYQQCYHLRADQAEEQKEKERESGGYWWLTDRVVMGKQHRSQLQGI